MIKMKIIKGMIASKILITNNSSNEGIKFDIQRNNIENFISFLIMSLIDYVLENKKNKY